MGLISFLTIIAEFVVYFSCVIFANNDPHVLRFIRILLIEIIYNALLTIIFYPLITILGNKLEKDFINNNRLLRFLD